MGLCELTSWERVGKEKRILLLQSGIFLRKVFLGVVKPALCLSPRRFGSHAMNVESNFHSIHERNAVCSTIFQLYIEGLKMGG